jgi:hypothetical protein
MKRMFIWSTIPPISVKIGVELCWQCLSFSFDHCIICQWVHMSPHSSVGTHVASLISGYTCRFTHIMMIPNQPVAIWSELIMKVEFKNVWRCQGGNMLSSWLGWNTDHVVLNYNDSLTARYNYLVKVFVEFHILVYSSSTEYFLRTRRQEL